MMGTNGEWKERDKESGEEQTHTGGAQILVSAGGGLRYKTLELNGAFEWPMVNRLNENQPPVRRNWRVETRIYF